MELAMRAIRKWKAFLVTAVLSLPGLSNTQSDASSAKRSQNPAPIVPLASYPIPPPVPFVTGIFEDADAPFSTEEVLIKNRWQSLQNGSEITVYAGADAMDPEQGIAIIAAGAAYPAEPTAVSVLTPVRAGAIRVVAAQSGLLLLTSATGSYVFTLNIASAAFTSVATVPLTLIPSSEISITTSGLAYSRVSQSYSGTVTVKNVSPSAIVVPLQIAFSALPSGVILVNATDAYNGNPVITAPATASLGPSQSVSFTVQFRNPTNTQITFTPAAYSGSLN
jgi:hypothetical protein